MLITLSGLDGSGKSTLIEALGSALKAKNHVVVVRHMTRDVGVYAVAWALLNLPRGARGTKGNLPAPPGKGGERPAGFRQRLRRAVVWNKSLRRLLYLPDLLLFQLFRFYVERVRHGILIMDRYFYDTLVDVAGPDAWTWARLLVSITPTPSIAVLLDVPPELAFRRKGEFSVDYLTRRREDYRRVFQWVPSAVVMQPEDLDRTTADLERLVAQCSRR
jgi:thymidylate kinase